MWKKNFRIRKVQACMLFIIIMLCTTLLNASVYILYALDQPYKDLRKECNPPDAVIFPYIRDDAFIANAREELLKLDEVEDVQNVPYHYINEEIKCKGKKLDYFMKLSTYNEKVFGNARTEGCKMSDIKTLDKNECFFPLCIANDNGIKIGDSIDIAFSTGVESYRIVGLYVEPYSTTSAFDCFLLVNQLPDGIGPSSQNIFVYMKNGAKTTDVEEAYRQGHDNTMPGEMKSVEEIMSNGLIAGNIIGAVFLAIGIIMMFVSALIINFIVRNTMHQDAKNIAVYKTMGYSQKTIQNIYLIFYFVITLAGCNAGIFSSQLLSNLILKGIYSNIGKVSASNPFYSGIPCSLIICTFVLVIVQLIVNKTKRVKPVYALNGMEDSNSKKKTYHGNSRFQFSALGIAMRSILRDKKGIIGVMITAITTIFSVNFVMISYDTARSMKDQNDYWLGLDRSDVIVTASSEEDKGYIEKILEDNDQIDYYTNECLGDGYVILSWKKGQSMNSMYAFIYDDYIQSDLPVIEGRNPAEPNEIAINTLMADHIDKHVGDYMEVYLGGKVKVNLLISGLYQNYYSMGRSCRLLKSTYQQNGYEEKCIYYSIYLKQNVNEADFIKELTSQVNQHGAVTKRTDMFSSIMNMIVEPQMNALPAVIVLVCIIGGMNIFSIVMLKNREAEKRNSIYKAIGYNTAHLVKSNLIYVLLIALCACVIALPLNLLSYASIMKVALSMFGFRAYPTTFVPFHLFLCNIGALALFVFCTFLSSRSIRRINVRNLVYE